MKLITENIDSDIYDYLEIGKTYKIKMVERFHPFNPKTLLQRINCLGKKGYTTLELWAEELKE